MYKLEIKKLYCDLAVCIGYWCGCPVAVKRLYDDLADVERYIQLVQQEASVAWKIHHPNIAAVCGVTLEKEVKKAWIIMELHSGSVSSVIDACQRDAAPLTVREKVDMAHDSLCGLDHIHSMVRKVNEIGLNHVVMPSQSHVNYQNCK